MKYSFMLEASGMEKIRNFVTKFNVVKSQYDW